MRLQNIHPTSERGVYLMGNDSPDANDPKLKSETSI